jgi:hypothetical protein
MKKFFLIFIIIIVVLAIAGAAYWYFGMQSNVSKESNQITNNPAPSAATSGMGAATFEPKVFATDDFSLTYPAGWRSVPAMTGVSAMIVKDNENITDPEAKKMNFQSYLAVSYDSSEGKTKEQIIDYVKKEITSALPDAVFSNEKNLTVNSRDAYATEATFTKSGVNFHVLMVVVWGNGSDLWILSFNTLEELWQNYISDFEEMTQSFVVKIKT